jgi:hypothetical protein
MAEIYLFNEVNLSVPVGPLLQRRAHLPSNLETVRLHYGWHVTRLPNQCYHRDLLAA